MSTLNKSIALVLGTILVASVSGTVVADDKGHGKHGGMVTKAKFMDMMSEKFDHMDKNKDGMLDAFESLFSDMDDSESQ